MIGATEIEREFASFVGSASFSCLVGKGVVHQNAHVVKVYPPLGTQAAASALATDLNAFAAAEHDPMKLRAFVAVFPRFAPRTEHAFEKRLWAQLQHLHEHDDPDVEWDPSVSDDADDPNVLLQLRRSRLLRRRLARVQLAHLAHLPLACTRVQSALAIRPAAR